MQLKTILAVILCLVIISGAVYLRSSKKKK